MNLPDIPPLVSVLVPLYNHACYVNRCLDSVLEDGYPRVEIIIIDDGSKDDSVVLARQWHEKLELQRIERFELKSRPNSGLTRTLNELIAKAHGDYLVFLASDDYLLPGGIAARVEYLHSHPHKFAVFGDCIVVDAEGSKTHDSGITDLHSGNIECLVKDDLLALELIYNWCVPGPVFMARRELYDRIGLYDESLAVEDWDMYLRIASLDLLGFIPKTVAAYRFHGSNSCLNENTKTIQLDSLVRTAWKNSKVFQGIHRFGLLYRHFKLKKYKSVAEGHFMTAFCCRIMYKLLYGLSIWRYKKILANELKSTRFIPVEESST